MLTIIRRVSGIVFATALAAALMTALTACKIHVDKAENGQERKVDIQTPLGGIQVNQDVKVRDTGLPIYPGAREKQKGSDGNGGQANVNISSEFFGLKVVVIEFLSDDPPEKVISYYRDQLKKFGGILECHTKNNKDGPHVEMNHKKNRDNKLTCEEDGGPTVELKVGTEDNQHIVSVAPQDGGKGSDFALVYVQARGDRKDSI